MSGLDIRTVVQEELNNIAPEVAIGTIDPAADLREALDIDSMDFLNFVTAKGLPLDGELRLPKLKEEKERREAG